MVKEAKITEVKEEKEKKKKVKATKVEKKEKKKKETSIFKEMKQVKWPSLGEIVKYSISTVLFVIIFAVFFQLIDLLSSFIKGLF